MMNGTRADSRLEVDGVGVDTTCTGWLDGRRVLCTVVVATMSKGTMVPPRGPRAADSMAASTKGPMTAWTWYVFWTGFGNVRLRFSFGSTPNTRSNMRYGFATVMAAPDISAAGVQVTPAGRVAGEGGRRGSCTRVFAAQCQRTLGQNACRRWSAHTANTWREGWRQQGLGDRRRQRGW